ncbi:MAG: protein kinase [Planctomycetota bacterium]|nr:protein kinase [Planctomycetota bacterium]
MTEATGDPEPGPDVDQDESLPKLSCPHCGAKYQPKRPTRGRRVRCRHCDHVWRHEPDTANAVAGALDGAAANWMRLGSTLLSRTDHASTLAHAVQQVSKEHVPLASEWIDKSLGRYDIRSVLGEGAMGYVLEAQDRDLKRTVALKILPARISPDREPIGLKMFLQEARVAAKLQHPNAVTIYEIGNEDGTYYFAMDRVQGVTLAALVDQHGPLPANQACYLVATAARALAAGHRLAIVHRDVKPSNIMIDISGLVKVTDFGLAHVAGIDGINELAARAVGTPGWMSPEAARCEEITPASDIYSLGLVLYAALTGKRLVSADTRSGLVREHCRSVSVRREDLPPGWPPRLRDVVVQCLQADPQDRYQSADSLAADLLRALAPSEDDKTLLLAHNHEKKPAGYVSSTLSRIALAVLILVAGVFGIWWWLYRAS